MKKSSPWLLFFVIGNLLSPLQALIMNILLLGAGGREHALAWKMSQSHHCDALFIAPGNAGTSQFGTNLSIAVTDFEAIKQACIENKNRYAGGRTGRTLGERCV